MNLLATVIIVTGISVIVFEPVLLFAGKDQESFIAANTVTGIGLVFAGLWLLVK